MQARLDDALDVQQQPALFGGCRKPGLVSAHHLGAGEIRLFRREAESTNIEDTRFEPFLWLAEPDLLKGVKTQPSRVERLSGSNIYQFLAFTHSWEDLNALSKEVSQKTGISANHPQAPQFFLPDPVSQYLLCTGQTYYNSMDLSDLRGLVVRTYTQRDLVGHRAENPHRIAALGLRQIGPQQSFELLQGDEAELLDLFQDRLRSLDPDLLIGHNLFKRDLELLDTRAKRRRRKLILGRTEERLLGRRTRMQVAEKSLEYPRYAISGRELVDCWILSVLHDVSGREMAGFELAEVADHFKLSTGTIRQPIEERAKLDTEAIAGIFKRLAYPYFLQSQLFPLRFEDVILRGNATRINHLFLREYFRQGHSVSSKPEVVHFAGGLTTLEHEGCAFGVYHCDVASLYPSVIIAYDLSPEGDELKIFTGMLRTLRDFRLLTKQKSQQAQDPHEKAFLDGLQTTFKILINSFYGYLGFGQGHFADFNRAAQVTQAGRDLLSRMMEWLTARQARLLEVDTDGIYFVPSEKFADTDWICELNKEFPDGVNVEFDGRYPAMYCHKMKNYALLQDDGSLLVRGSGLRSRSMEPYLRAFLEDLITEVLTHGLEKCDEIFERYRSGLADGTLSVEQLAKTETLIDSPSVYAKKIDKGQRNRAAVYELALQSPGQPQAGESLSYYVTGNKANVTVYDHCRPTEDFDPDNPDLNEKYYLKKLKATYKKFLPILSKEPLRSPIPYDELPTPP